MTELQLRVLFVCVADFTGPGEKQVLGFAEQLLGRGHAVMVSILGNVETARTEGADRIPGLQYRQHRFRRSRLREADLAAAREFQPTVIHAFNSRVPVIAAASAYSEATGAPVFVHFEDDEWGMRKGAVGASPLRRVARLGRRIGSRLHPPLWYYSTAASLRWVGRHARAFDALTPTLATHVSERLARECAAVLPITPTIAGTADAQDEEVIEIPDGRELLLYTGRVFLGNAADFELGLRAVADVQARGHDVAFAQVGGSLPPVDLERMATEAGIRPGSARFLGYVPFRAIPQLLRRATALLQPGLPTEVNRLRLPSKLQAYLASGTPTITYATGFAELLTDRDNVLKTHTGEARELADRIVDVLVDGELRARLQRNGPLAAARLFDPVANTDALIDHYRRWLSPTGEPAQPVGTTAA